MTFLTGRVHDAVQDDWYCDTCVETEDDNIVCVVCDKGDPENLLLCDGCENAQCAYPSP
jgi:hypothetical protein